MLKRLSSLTAFFFFAASISASANHKIDDVPREKWESYHQSCITSVDGWFYELRYNTTYTKPELHTTRFEKMLGSGGAITCSSHITLMNMTPDRTDAERRDLCLVFNSTKKTYLGFATGERDAYGRCKDRLEFTKVDISDQASFIFPKDQTDNVPHVSRCTARISGEYFRLTYSAKNEKIDRKLTLTEKMFGGDCPSTEILASLLPELSPLERSAFCLVYDKDKKEYIGVSEGSRDAFSVCKTPKKSLCDKVNDSKEAAMAIVGLGTGTAVGATAAASAAGVSAVAHSSGAVILTGSSGYIAGTFGTLGASVLGILTAPGTAATAMVSIIAVGGAVFICM